MRKMNDDYLLPTSFTRLLIPVTIVIELWASFEEPAYCLVGFAAHYYQLHAI
jgi:hypothetical protein